MALQCAVCARMTTLFNYGVPSCNACKMFFRRVISGAFLEECSSGCGSQKCRFCRFQICLRSGMNYIPIGNSLATDDSGFVLLTHLGNLDRQREDLRLNFYNSDNLSIRESADQNIRFVRRHHTLLGNTGEWGFITAMTSVNYLKNFPFMNLLGLNDRAILLRHGFLYFWLFAEARRCLQSSSSQLTYPDGTEVVPKVSFKNAEGLEKRIRGRLTGRAYELKVTNEEFLLLSSVLFCNPVLPGLSETGTILITSYQKMYTSVLLKHCLLTHQQNGPSRFTDLLSFSHTIAKTKEDICYHHLMSMLSCPGLSYKRIFHNN